MTTVKNLRLYYVYVFLAPEAKLLISTYLYVAQAVDNYLDHYLSSFGRVEKIRTLIESNGSYCFMPEEQATLDRMGQNIRDNLKLFYFHKRMLVPVDNQSFPVSEAVDFPHLVWILQRCILVPANEE